jgi:Ni,Fe-hydrogenase III small subunit
VVAVADKAQQRLCRRFRKRAAEHEPAPKIVVAIGAVDREPTPRG